MGVRKIRVAMAQMLVEGGRLEENLARAERRIREAADMGCRVVVLPEVMDLGWLDKSARHLATPVPGSVSRRLCRAAQKYGIAVVSGMTEKNKGRFHNTSLLISAEGRILAWHRKINELKIGLGLYTVGTELKLTDTSFGRVGIPICADLSPQDGCPSGHALGQMGARLLLSSCAWAVPPDHDNEKEPYGGMWEGSYVALAKRFKMAVIGVSNVGWVRHGAWAGWKCIGCSLAVGPDGRVLAKGPYGVASEALMAVELPLK